MNIEQAIAKTEDRIRDAKERALRCHMERKFKDEAFFLARVELLENELRGLRG